MVGISLDITEKKNIEKKLYETEHKLQGMSLVGASTAHELRTPLATISIATQSIQEVLPKLIHAYELAKQANLAVEKINPIYFKSVKQSLNSIEVETRAAFTFIDMLLMNLQPIEAITVENFSMASCIDEALERYPFQEDEKKFIQWSPSQDFIVKGKKLLITHILFNLLKNAIYYVTKSDRKNAAISIWLENSKISNTLFFKDTGTGISADILPHIFDRFFTKTPHGAGIGLTFCKLGMESVGGTIICESVENSYTLFILTFPK